MSEPGDRGTSPRWGLMFAWTILAGVLLYLGVFAVLMLDGPVFGTNVIENGIRSVSPQLHTAVGEVLQFVYFPLIKLVELADLR